MSNKKSIVFLFAFIFIVSIVGFSINTKNNEPVQNEVLPEDTLEDTLKDTLKTNPQIDIQVKKEYDDQGNIIRYDSSYSYIYTYPDGNQKKINTDSIFQSFQPYFFDRSFDIMQDPFKRLFESDSSYERHFFDQDYFMQQFEKDHLLIEKMIKQMDSLRNQFLKENYPHLEQQKGKPENKKDQTIYEI
ncbi:MAG: hypothetical protein V2I54_10680 [Bacteroidales bacterium]|jgi:hypothetical protein|nr:hypothetical protein [Bacteroidales bacterium]